jgi:hypothetical protein
MSKLLLDEPPLIILPHLAVKIGLKEAAVLQQVHYWILHYSEEGDKRHFHDGRCWVYNSYESWQNNFPWYSIDYDEVYKLENSDD